MNDSTLCLASSAVYYVSPTLQVKDVSLLIQQFDNVTVVAFKGTDPTNWRDLVRDVDVIPENDPILGICHQGFLNGAKSILPLLEPILMNKDYILTGHSLGGALAIVAGAFFVSKNIKPLGITTFGAPNTSFGGIGRILKDVPGVRYKNANDPVPNIPTWPFVCDRELTIIGKNAFDPIVNHFIDKYFEDLPL